MNGFGGTMYVVLYSIDQKCFHVERLKDYLEKNNQAMKDKKQNSFFMVEGLFSAHKDASEKVRELIEAQNPVLRLEEKLCS